jgi:hypothetical protein
MKKINTEDLTDDKMNPLVGTNDERFADLNNIKLASDESILHKTQTIIIKGVRYEAVLTNKRLITVESETGHIREDILFEEIDLAISGENKFHEPVITLIINLPDGDKRTIEFIFIHFVANKNIVELGKCMEILKENGVQLGSRSPLSGSALLSRKTIDESIVEKPVSRPAVPEWTIVGPLRNDKQSKEEEDPPERTPLATIGVIILILVVMIVGITLIGQSLHEKPPAVPHNTTAVVTSEPTPAPTPTPTPQPTPTNQVNPFPTETPPTYTIPPTGVWVKVQYLGNFSGSIGAYGRNIDVSGTGVKWYQVPVVDPKNIDGSIAKLDGTLDKLVVEIYKDGTLNSRKSTTAPYGVIDLRSTGTEEIVREVVITPVPTQAPVSWITDANRPQINIPPSGVWVMVQYPGNFSGYIGARGRNIDVSGTGIKWYQLPVIEPVIDGSIEKLDGSLDKLDVDVYKDGTLISRSITRKPYGIIELHMTGSEKIMNDVVTTTITTPVPTPAIQAVEDYLPEISIPDTGVWVRVYYPGYFSGTVGGDGDFTQIKSTGDQLYKIPSNVGIVEGAIQKDDGSVGRIVTEVYKDGTLISRLETRKPEGLIDMHVTVNSAPAQP